MNQIIDKLKQYLEVKNIKVSHAESCIGVSNGTLSKPFSKGTTIKADTLEKFLNHYKEINTDWLFRDIGGMTKKTVGHTNEGKQLNIEDIIANKILEKLKPLVDKVELQEATISKLILELRETKRKVSR